MSNMKCYDPECENKDPIRESDCVKCFSCNSSYHYVCAGVSETTYRKKNETKKKEWRCPQNCRVKVGAETAKPNYEKLSKSLEEVEFDTVLNTIKDPDLKLVFSCLMKKIIGLETSVMYMSNVFDDIKAKSELNEVKIKELEATLEQREEQIETLEIKLNSQEQYSRRYNIEIYGLEEKKDEDVYELVTKVVKKVCPNFKEENVDYAHRLPTRNKKYIPSIIAVLKSRRQRAEILDNWKREDIKIHQREIIADCERKDGNVYIHENVSAYLKRLRWLARKIADEKNYKYVWFRKECVLVKKEVKSSVIEIINEKDLEKIK